MDTTLAGGFDSVNQSSASQHPGAVADLAWGRGVRLTGAFAARTMHSCGADNEDQAGPDVPAHAGTKATGLIPAEAN